VSFRPSSSRRVLLAAAGLLLVAAGCGDGGGSADGSASAATEATVPAPTGAAVQGSGVPEPMPSSSADAVPMAAAFAPYADFGTDAEAGTFPRTIRHAMGETTLDEAPVRVVTLDTGELDAMVELGIEPVGVVDYGSDGLPAYFDPATIEGVEVVGTIQELNLEAIARLQPDLILSSSLRHEALYPQLSQIAPTVFAERPGVTWKQNFELYAQAVGREAEAAETVQRYEQRLAELDARLPADRPEVSVVRVMADGNVRLYQRANFLGILLTDLGFPRPAPQNVDDFATEVSLEQLGQADGELILLAVFDAAKNTHAETITGSPLWQSLDGVQAGGVEVVDDQTWIGGIGYHAAFHIMDELAELVA
jgi:iron complex transport system substrate-binding protein